MIESPVQVARTIRSTSDGSLPAAARARRLATSAMSETSTWEMRRSLIPVRVVIHSSLVPVSFCWSWLDMTGVGRHLPQTVISEFGTLTTSGSTAATQGLERNPDIVERRHGDDVGSLHRSTGQPGSHVPGPDVD